MIEIHKTGQIGEEITCKFLKNKGYSILDRNYRRPWGELDIVTEKEGVLHFIEVKSVSCETLPNLVSRENADFSPEDNMHYKKRERMARIIETYLLDKDTEKDWQANLALVYIDKINKKARVNLIENIDLL